MFTEIKNMKAKLPVSHIIRIGEVVKHKTKPGVTYPTKLDHFQVAKAMPDADGRYPVDKDYHKSIGDDKPKALSIILPADDIANFCPTYLANYKKFNVPGIGGKKVSVVRRYCWGNGEKALRLNQKTGLYVSMDCPGDGCNGGKPCEFRIPNAEGKKECKMTCKLHCMLPSLQQFGSFAKFESHSDITTEELITSLKIVKQMTNGLLTGLPLKLKIVGRRGRYGTYYVVHTSFDGDLAQMYDMLSKLIDTRQKLVAIGQQFKQVMIGSDVEDAEDNERIGQHWLHKAKAMEGSQKLLLTGEVGDASPVVPAAPKKTEPDVVSDNEHPECIPIIYEGKRYDVSHNSNGYMVKIDRTTICKHDYKELVAEATAKLDKKAAKAAKKAAKKAAPTGPVDEYVEIEINVDDLGTYDADFCEEKGIFKVKIMGDILTIKVNNMDNMKAEVLGEIKHYITTHNKREEEFTEEEEPEVELSKANIADAWMAENGYKSVVIKMLIKKAEAAAGGYKALVKKVLAAHPGAVVPDGLED